VISEIILSEKYINMLLFSVVSEKKSLTWRSLLQKKKDNMIKLYSLDVESDSFH
jgi:hypothetical protein